MGIRVIESPTAHAVYQNGDLAGQPKPAFSGVKYGQTFVNGIAHVDEAALWPCVNTETNQPQNDRTWHLLIWDGLKDITPEDSPPEFPVPANPYAATQAARNAAAASRSRAGAYGRR